MIFTEMRLTRAVHSSLEELQKIASLLMPGDDGASSEKFMKAATSYQTDETNQMIKEAVARFLHQDNLSEGLEAYCRKFGLDADFSTETRLGMVRFIYSHASEIDSKLKEKGM